MGRAMTAHGDERGAPGAHSLANGKLGSGCQYFLDQTSELSDLVRRQYAREIACASKSTSSAATDPVADALDAIAAIQATVCELRTMTETLTDKDGNTNRVNSIIASGTQH